MPRRWAERLGFMEIMLPFFVVCAFGAALFLVLAPILLVGLALIHRDRPLRDRIGIHFAGSLAIGAVCLLLAMALMYMLAAPFAMGR